MMVHRQGYLLCIPYHNVKMVNISDKLTTDQGLIALLKAVPNLESLVFNQGDGDEDDVADSVEGKNNHDNEFEGDVVEAAAECKDNYDNEDDIGTGCLFLHLKSVCFRNFVGNPRVMKWVRRILREAKALQMMTIRY